MYKIIDSETVGTDEKGTFYVRALVCCDSTSDIPNANITAKEVLTMGSTAWILSTGEVYGLASDGTWKKQ